MITPAFLQYMARYNRWQNGSIYGAADGLDDAARKKERGAFFSSIHGTLNHLLWGDAIWMARFDGGEPPEVELKESADFVSEWHVLKARRNQMDDRILVWAAGVKPEQTQGEFKWYSGALQRHMSQPMAVCLMQLFNHQTHHRGQVHAMLTAAGAKPDDTDLPFMPAEA